MSARTLEKPLVLSLSKDAEHGPCIVKACDTCRSIYVAPVRTINARALALQFIPAFLALFGTPLALMLLLP